MLEVAGRCALRVQLKVIKDNAKEAVSKETASLFSYAR